MSPELELIDQLCGGAMPLSVLRRLFADDGHFRRVLAADLSRGVIVLRRHGDSLPIWEAEKLLREDRELFARDGVFALPTETGGEAFDSGRWNRTS